MNSQKQRQFQSLLDEHSKIVFKVVHTYARNPDDQLELAQEVRYQLWKAFPGYQQSRKFSTWMYQIALNTAISWSRKKRLRDLHSASLVIAEGRASPESQEVSDLYCIIDSLDELNRALLLLYLEEKSHAEIAEVLGITPINVATRLSRLKEKLRKENNNGTR